MKQNASDLVNKLQQERPFELGAFLNILLMNMQKNDTRLRTLHRCKYVCMEGTLLTGRTVYATSRELNFLTVVMRFYGSLLSQSLWHIAIRSQEAERILLCDSVNSC